MGSSAKIKVGEGVIEKTGGSFLASIFKAPINIDGLLKAAGTETVTFIKGVKGGKVAVIGQGMDKVKKVAGGLKNPEVFKPSVKALNEWNDLLKNNAGQQLSDEIVKKTKIFKENQTWINDVKTKGYDILDTGGGNTSTFYNMEKDVIYGSGKKP